MSHACHAECEIETTDPSEPGNSVALGWTLLSVTIKHPWIEGTITSAVGDVRNTGKEQRIKIHRDDLRTKMVKALNDLPITFEPVNVLTISQFRHRRYLSEKVICLRPSATGTP